MKRITVFALLAILISVLSGCSVTSEKYKYQQRIDRLYALLSTNELSSFAAGDIVQAGNSIDKRVAADKKLAESYNAVQTEEAINTFDGQQTMRFFRDIILRELNRGPFYEFMNYLDANAQADFANRSGFEPDLNAKYANAEFKRFYDNLRVEYRLKGFSNQQIAEFFRSVSFAEVSRRELFHVLRVLKTASAAALAEFKAGNTSSAAQVLDQAALKYPVFAADLKDIKDRSGLGKLDSARFLDIYYRVILKEMDRDAMQRTLDKF